MIPTRTLRSPEPPPKVGPLVGFRPIEPDDASRLVDAFDRLSLESRYRRFLAPIRSLSDKDVHAFTHIDFVDHVAWVAELLGEAGRPFAGVGRWIRSKRDPSVAEVALTVVDAYQRQGLGAALLRLLAASAVARGVLCFEGIVLADNQPMRSLLRSVGAAQVGYETGAIIYRLPVSHLVNGGGSLVGAETFATVVAKQDRRHVECDESDDEANSNPEVAHEQVFSSDSTGG